MKKIVLILFCLIMILGITGCSEKEKENSNIEEYMIVDKTKEIKDFVCASALDKFYTDDNYSYYWSCIKDDYIVVKYKDGKEEKVSSALKNKKISINDLDKFNIEYIKEAKKTINSGEIDFYITKLPLSHDIRFNSYYKANDRTIYFAGNLEEFYIKDFDETITLKEYLTTSFQTLDDGIGSITNKLDLKYSLFDGGTQIYKSEDKDITMIVCNTIKDDKNVFIGDYSLEYQEDCQN